MEGSNKGHSPMEKLVCVCVLCVCHSEAGSGWNGVLGIRELPHENVITLEVTI